MPLADFSTFKYPKKLEFSVCADFPATLLVLQRRLFKSPPSLHSVASRGTGRLVRCGFGFE